MTDSTKTLREVMDKRGQTFVETPVSIWKEQLATAKATNRWPSPVGHLMFSHPGDYGCTRTKNVTASAIRAAELADEAAQESAMGRA